MRITLWLLLTAIVCIILAVCGGVLAWLQQQRISQWVEVTATVQTVDPPGERGLLGEPRLGYAYMVGETEYIGTQLTPLGLFERGALRRDIERHFPEGAQVVAYHHPLDPARAFLRPRPSFVPWMFMWLPLAVGALLWPFAINGGLLWPRPKLTLERGGGWYLVQPQTTLHRRRRNLILTAAVWLGYGGVIAGGYMLVSTPPYDALLLPAAVAWAVPVAVPLTLLVAQQRRLAAFEDATIGLTREDPPVAGPVVVRYQQALARPGRVGEATVALICERRDGLASEPLLRTSAVVTRHRHVDAGEVLRFEHRFEIPGRKRRPSSEFDRWQYPRIDWLIRVDLRLEHGPNYTARFPVHLHGREDEA